MLAPHSVTTVDAEHCGRCVAAESRLRREEERVFVVCECGNGSVRCVHAIG